jgi:glycogen(starch) synthase
VKILTLSNYYPPFEIGGWEQLTRDVCDRLKHRGHAVHVLTSNHRAKELKKDKPGIIRKLHLESPDHVHYHSHYILFRHWRERQNILLLKKIVRGFNPDIIFVNGMWNLPISLAQHAEQVLPGRVVYYLASTWPMDVDAHTAYWSIHFNGYRLRFLRRYLLNFLMEHFLPNTPRTSLTFPRALSVSKYMRDYLVSHKAIPKSRITVVYNGVELDRFIPKKWGPPRDNVRLIYAGRFSPNKGVHTVIEGLCLLMKAFPEISVNATLLGSGAASYTNHLRALVEQCEMHRIISFRDWVPRRKMSTILGEYDILIFPSPFPEALPRIVQEAMACGLVVIGTTTGGTPEILQDGVNGLTFEAGNASSLAEKIAQTASCWERMITLGKAARKTVEARFGLDRMVDELEANFNQLIQEN